MPIDAKRLDDHLASLEGVDVLRAQGGTFYYYDPRRILAPDKRQPFATIVTTDAWDMAASRLEARGAYRLNLGVERATYRALLGPEPAWGKDGGLVETGHDFAALDQWLPHPYYAPMDWICIVLPSEAREADVRAKIAEAHAVAKRAYERHHPTSS